MPWKTSIYCAVLILSGACKSVNRSELDGISTDVDAQGLNTGRYFAFHGQMLPLTHQPGKEAAYVVRSACGKEPTFLADCAGKKDAIEADAFARMFLGVKEPAHLSGDSPDATLRRLQAKSLELSKLDGAQESAEIIRRQKLMKLQIARISSQITQEKAGKSIAAPPDKNVVNELKNLIDDPDLLSIPADDPDFEIYKPVLATFARIFERVGIPLALAGGAFWDAETQTVWMYAGTQTSAAASGACRGIGAKGTTLAFSLPTAEQLLTLNSYKRLKTWFIPELEDTWLNYGDPKTYLWSKSSTPVENAVLLEFADLRATDGGPNSAYPTYCLLNRPEQTESTSSVSVRGNNSTSQQVSGSQNTSRLSEESDPRFLKMLTFEGGGLRCKDHGNAELGISSVFVLFDPSVQNKTIKTWFEANNAQYQSEPIMISEVDFQKDSTVSLSGWRQLQRPIALTSEQMRRIFSGIFQPRLKAKATAPGNVGQLLIKSCDFAS